MKSIDFRPVWAGAAVLLFAQVGFGQATRTWVSGVGDDVNPCSRTAPCKTFAGAISKTAAGGTINAMDPGGYGAVTITKAITIDGTGTIASILSSGTNAIVVNVTSSDTVVIRNISMDGAGSGINGIRVIGGGSLHVENVTIAGHTQRGIDFVPSSTAALIVNNAVLRNNGSGILVKPNPGVAAMAHLGDVVLKKNQSYGLRVEDNSTVTVRNTSSINNLNNGFLAISTAGGPVNLTIEKSISASNRNGGGTSSGIQSNGGQAVIRLNDVVVTDNDFGLNLVSGGTVSSWSNNKIAGNTVNGAPNAFISNQ